MHDVEVFKIMRSEDSLVKRMAWRDAIIELGGRCQAEFSGGGDSSEVGGSGEGEEADNMLEDILSQWFGRGWGDGGPYRSGTVRYDAHKDKGTIEYDYLMGDTRTLTELFPYEWLGNYLSILTGRVGRDGINVERSPWLNKYQVPQSLFDAFIEAGNRIADRARREVKQDETLGSIYLSRRVDGDVSICIDIDREIRCLNFVVINGVCSMSPHVTSDHPASDEWE
jgi:hypothetical protein